MRLAWRSGLSASLTLAWLFDRRQATGSTVRCVARPQCCDGIITHRPQPPRHRCHNSNCQTNATSPRFGPTAPVLHCPRDWLSCVWCGQQASRSPPSASPCPAQELQPPTANVRLKSAAARTPHVRPPRGSPAPACWTRPGSPPPSASPRPSRSSVPCSRSGCVERGWVYKAA